MSRGSAAPYSVLIEMECRPGRRKTYRLRWVNPRTGKRESQACGSDRLYARDRASAKRQELKALLRGDRGQHMLSELRDRLAGWMIGKAAETIAASQRACDRFIAMCGDSRLRFLDRAALVDFRAGLAASSLSHAGVNKHLRHLKSALSYAVDAGWLETNPAKGWKQMELRVAEARLRILEPAELTDLLEAIEDPGLACLVTVAYYAGLRRTELCRLRWVDVDLDRRRLLVCNRAGELTKSRRIRAVPLRQVAWQSLSSWREQVPQVAGPGGLEPKHDHIFVRANGRPYRPDWLSRWFAGRVAAAKLDPPATLHDLRRSFSTHLQRDGIDAEIVRQLGGWSSMTVVRRHYTGDVSQAHDRAIRRLDDRAG